MGGFLINALLGWLDKKSKDKQSRAAYDARYTNNPRWQLRNQLLTSLWNDNHLVDRFAGAFPDPKAPENAGFAVKSPENVLRSLITPPRDEGRPGTGFDFARLLLGQGAQAAQAAMAGGGGGGFMSGSGGSATGLDAPVVPFDQQWDPFRYRSNG